MKRMIAGLALSTVIATSAVQAQTLQPQMSAQDVNAQMQVERGHVIVPILTMIFLLLAAGGSASPVLDESDERLKTDIRAVGRTGDGLTLYEFGYLHRDGRYRGVMAQEVLTHRPEAVIRGPGGFLMVNYGMLGLDMVRVH
jgi:hypothetical protein